VGLLVAASAHGRGNLFTCSLLSYPERGGPPLKMGILRPCTKQEMGDMT